MHEWIDIGLLLGSALLGGGLVMGIAAPRQSWMKLLISFSGAYLLGLCMAHLLPFAFDSAPGIAGLLVLCGFLLQLILEYFSEGIEHGHAHTHRISQNRFPLAILIALFVHAFIEGMPFGDHNHDHHHHDSLLIGIILHKVPVAIVLTSMILHSGVSRMKTWVYLILFALMSPLGTLTYSLFLNHSGMENTAVLTGAVNALLVGVLLHVSTTILFESTDGHKFNLMKFLSVILGFVLSALIF